VLVVAGDVRIHEQLTSPKTGIVTANTASEGPAANLPLFVTDNAQR
jgi:hypothetical protein